MTNDNTSKRRVPNFSTQQPQKKALSLHFKYNKATSTKCIVSNISTTYTVGTSPFFAVNDAARTASKKVSPIIDRQQKKKTNQNRRESLPKSKKREIFSYGRRGHGETPGFQRRRGGPWCSPRSPLGWAFASKASPAPSDPDSPILVRRKRWWWRRRRFPPNPESGAMTITSSFYVFISHVFATLWNGNIKWRAKWS